MWQVVTATQNPWAGLFAGAEQELPNAEIDELIAALADLLPTDPSLRPTLDAPSPPFCALVAAAPPPHRLYLTPPTALPPSIQVNNEVISALEMPRPVQAPAELPLTPAMRKQLLQLRTTILLAVEQQQLRSVLLCSADPQGQSAGLAAALSQLLAEYERLKVASIEVVAEAPGATNWGAVLPFGYTFQIRRTKMPNRYEIASSLGSVRLEDWLKWWSPTLVLQELKKVFDVIVISAPPITAQPDVALLAGAVDGVILAATEHVTAYASIVETQQRLLAARAQILGVMLEEQAAAPSVRVTVRARVRELWATVIKSK